MEEPPTFEGHTVEAQDGAVDLAHPTVWVGVGAPGEPPIALLATCGRCLIEDIQQAIRTGEPIEMHDDG